MTSCVRPAGAQATQGVIVLGMHRSGTSLVTAVLERLGAYVGAPDALMPAQACNPLGFWERIDIVELHERTEEALLPPRAWWQPRAGWLRMPLLEPGSLPDTPPDFFEPTARAILAALGAHAPWAMKDPRLCFLLPYWRRVLPAVACVLVTRNPMETARSIQSRDRISISVGLALWEAYTLAALRASVGLPRVSVEYADLMRDPPGVVAALHAALAAAGVALPGDPRTTGLRALVKPGLQRQSVEVAALEGWLTAAQQRLYEAMRDGSAATWTAVPALSAGAAEALRGFDAMRRTACRDEQAAEIARRHWHNREREAIALRERMRLVDHGVDTWRRSRTVRMATAVGELARRVLRRPAAPTPDAFVAEHLAACRALCAEACTPWPGVEPLAPCALRVVALLAAHNEERFIAPCLDHLAAQGVQAYLIDNESDDRTVEIARGYLGRGLLGIETFPRRDPMPFLDLLRRKEELAMELDADWFVHCDPDEFRLSPHSSRTLQQALAEADALDCNAVNFLECTFVPCREAPDHDHADFLRTMRWYYPFLPSFPHRLNAWKRQPERVDLVSAAGHRVAFPGLRMYPVPFCMRHYLFLSPAHAVRKYRSRRYPDEERAAGFHGWRHEFSADSIRLPAAADLRVYTHDDALDTSQPRTVHVLEPSPRGDA